jgi:hypothetical protein
MKKADQVLKTLADLYDFRKRLRQFRIVKNGKSKKPAKPTAGERRPPTSLGRPGEGDVG